MAKPVIKPNPRINQVFDDLERFFDFCREFGYRYNEAELYNWKSYAYQQFMKFSQGKPVKDMWFQDQRRTGRP
jgi:hypothetical protein